MALIECPECKINVSDKAQSCPKCGCPIIKGVQTIEQTSKKYKKQVLISSLFIVIGFFTVFANAYIGVVLIFIGLIWLLIGMVMSWWHHG